MAQIPKVILEMEGLDELRALAKKAGIQVEELQRTLDEINMCRLELQVKINQPQAGTDG